MRRMGEDQTAKIAELEAYSKVQSVAIAELKSDLRTLRDGVEEIRRDIHAARIAGRMGLGIALLLGGVIAWVTGLVTR